MNRRKFIKTAAFTVPVITSGSHKILKKNNVVSNHKKPVIIDGMGEIRLDYPMSLITEIIQSGTRGKNSDYVPVPKYDPGYG